MKIHPHDLIDCLAELKDPRIDRTKKHALIDIIFIAVTATLCGAKNWVDIADFGEAKKESFSEFLDLRNGIPSHDTFRRVFILLPPDHFFSIFKKWISAVTENADLEQICIDGKSLRATFEKGKKCSALHMVNAWSTGVGLALGQVQTDKKSNEITAIPELLGKLNIEGTIISMDAMGCQTKIAKKIREGFADYLLALKGNQGSLEKKVKDKFLETSMPGPKDFTLGQSSSLDESSHGRKEKRSCRVIKPKNEESFNDTIFSKWPDLKSLIEIKSERINRKTGLINEETHYYISSASESAEFFLKSVRKHWEVENKLHWVLDVVFKEDECPITAGYSAQNFAMLRQFALNLIKLEPSDKSIRRKRNLGGWDNSFLMRLVAGARYLDA